VFRTAIPVFARAIVDQHHRERLVRMLGKLMPNETRVHHLEPAEFRDCPGATGFFHGFRISAQEVLVYAPEIRSIPAQQVIAASITAQDYQHVAAPMRALSKLLWTHLKTSSAKSVGPEIVIWGGTYGDMQPFTLEWMIPIAGPISESDQVRAYTLPEVPEMGVVRHIGEYEQLGEAFTALTGWLEDHGYERAGNQREVYVHYDQDCAQNITEVQVPVRQKA
jgi:effector-binding domain-containing protein